MNGQFQEKPRPTSCTKDSVQGSLHLLTILSFDRSYKRIHLDYTIKITHGILIFYISTCVRYLDTKVTCKKKKTEKTTTESTPNLASRFQDSMVSVNLFRCSRVKLALASSYFHQKVANLYSSKYVTLHIWASDKWSDDMICKKHKLWSLTCLKWRKKTMVHKFQSSNVYFISSLCKKKNGWCIVIE